MIYSWHYPQPAVICLIMGDPETIHRWTEAEYLAMERHAETKSEFYDGEIFAIAGGTAKHSRIATNVAALFNNQLKDHACVPFNGDLRIKIEATGLNTYPDLSVVCGPLKFADDVQDTVTNPTLVVEVLSDSTEAYDRGKKFEHYRRIPTLKEYLLVSQNESRIEQFLRAEGNQWLFQEAAGLEASLRLPSLEITLSLAEVYVRVEFAQTRLRTPTVKPGSTS